LTVPAVAPPHERSSQTSFFSVVRFASDEVFQQTANKKLFDLAAGTAAKSRRLWRRVSRAVGLSQASAMFARRSCRGLQRCDLDGIAEVLKASDEALRLLVFRTLVKMVGTKILVEGAIP
jgi:hypothetical protein